MSALPKSSPHSSSSPSRTASGSVVTWKNVAWLNQTRSPVTGWRCTASRTAVVRSRPSPSHCARMPRPRQYSVTFNAPGQYNYACTVHPGMSGRVIVQ